ncbi:spore germination protein [Metabacillus niabensis]|uniref:spore germination protein n=1 Tax=Metabacillus niabensis TaxID=324854 RepID=UPI001CF9DE97|nr:spore germination protein [Metabacillus niabensis]
MNTWGRMFKKKTQNVFNDETDSSSIEYDLSPSLEDNIGKVREVMGHSGDLIIREFEMGKPLIQKVATIYLNGLTDKDLMGNLVIEKLMADINVVDNKEGEWPPDLIGAYVKDHLLTVTHVEVAIDLKKLLSLLLTGQTIVLIDRWNKAFACASQGGEIRSIQEPTTENSVRGPKESFTESLITNTSLIRRRIKSPNVWLETRKLGKITQTDIGVMYINGIANEKLINEVRERLDKIDVDEIQGSNTIEEWIADDILTPWPTIMTTERPDVVSGNLLEGRIAIFVDGTPIPLIVPATWNQFFQTAEDYYLRWNISVFLRFIRIISFLITLLGPSLFIAFISFHPELIPTPLLINLAAQRQAIPFPVIIEALLMEFTFEVLREAGIRMPRPVGQAVSIVGALVLGEAAVSAGIVSSAMVIVVAATAIASFTIPHYSMTDAVRLLRFIMMLLASTFGLYGIGLGVILLVSHTVSLRSFGIPYLAPFAPLIVADQKDAILRIPKPFMKKRPRLISQKKTNRMESQNDGPFGEGNE